MSRDQETYDGDGNKCIKGWLSDERYTCRVKQKLAVNFNTTREGEEVKTLTSLFLLTHTPSLLPNFIPNLCYANQ